MAGLGLWFILQQMTGFTQTDEYRSLLKRDFDRFNDAPLLRFMVPGISDQESPDHFRRWSGFVRINSQSVRFTRTATYHPKPEQIARRGSITTFSRHSRLRMRESLSTASLDASECFGLTLTLPWQNGLESLQACLERYRECYNRFTTYFRRSFPCSAAIFRHELQRRKMPHCHLVVFFSHADVEKGADIQELRYKCFKLWNDSLLGYYGGGSKTAFALHGVKLDRLNDRVAMYRYVSDHASKSKQAQLGYKGKQWGFINRKLISIQPYQDLQFRFQSDLLFFQRHISKLCRFFVKSDCVFGRKLSHKTNGVSISFLKKSSVSKILNYMQKDGRVVYYDVSKVSSRIVPGPWISLGYSFAPLVCSRLRNLLYYIHFKDSFYDLSSFCCSVSHVNKCLSNLLRPRSVGCSLSYV